jgi:putative ABC transport system permease protein
MLGLRKILRDGWFARTRLIVMIAALVTGLVGWGTLVRARSVLVREAPRNYMESDPAAVLLDMDAVSSEAVAAVRGRSDIHAAVRRSRLEGRFRVSGSDETRRAVFFVIDDFENMPIAKIFPQSGAWPPAPKTVLVERSSLPALGGERDGPIEVELLLPSGSRKVVAVSGVAHEPALAPANTEQAIYVYARAIDLETWGQPAPFTELRFSPKGDLTDVQALEKSARSVAEFIEQSGLGHVDALRIPPPERHPHQSQMTTVLTMFVLFAGLILLLTSLLTASLIESLMARQVREIAVLKTLGASSGRLAFMYTLAVLLLALSALGISWVPSALGGDQFVRIITQLLNFDVVDSRPSWLAVLFQVTVAIGVPLVTTWPILRRATATSVVAALSDHGTQGAGFGSSRLEVAVARVTNGAHFLRYAVREALRRRRRFTLAVALLTVSGSIFLAAVNTAGAWNRLTARLSDSHHYDFEVQIRGGAHQVGDRIAALPSVAQVETWSRVDVGVSAGGKLPIQTTYPDGGHGAFRLYSVPPGEQFVTFDIEQGRFLDQDNPPDDGAAHEIVINQVVPGADDVGVGQELVLSVDGRDHTFRVVGKVEEVGRDAGAYVSASTFQALATSDHSAMLLRVRAKGDIDAAVREVDRALSESGVPVLAVIPLTLFRNAVAAHFEVMVNSLLALAVIASIVGGLGLGAALSSNVSEGIRELGVLRALGASRRELRRLVLIQAWLVALLSAIAAIGMGLAMSWGIGVLLGEMSFSVPLPLEPNLGAVSALLVGFAAIASFASALPATQAARTTVARALRAL